MIGGNSLTIFFTARETLICTRIKMMISTPTTFVSVSISESMFIPAASDFLRRAMALFWEKGGEVGGPLPGSGSLPMRSLNCPSAHPAARL